MWEAKGLLPQAERTASGYRLFSEDDLEVLRFIRRAKALGLTPDEINDVLGLQRGGAQPCGRVTEMLTPMGATGERPPLLGPRRRGTP